MSEKVYCGDCKYYHHEVISRFGLSWERCLHPEKRIDTATKKVVPFCEDANKNNDCKYFEAKPPKPPSLFSRIMKWLKGAV